MARIAYLKTPRTKGYITLGLLSEGGNIAYTVPRITYSEIGSPVRGDEIGEDTVVRLAREDELFRAERRALSILSYADNSERMLRMKLSRLGFSREAIAHAVKTAVGNGYIDEERQLRIKISELANIKLRGRYYILEYLRGRGYDIGLVSEVIDKLSDEGEIDFQASFERLAEKKGTRAREEKLTLLKKYGYRK